MKIFDYQLKREIEIPQYNQKSLFFLYETAIGRFFLKGITKPFISKIYGKYNDSRLSKRKIAPFIRKHKIDMQDYEEKEYKSFNDFFTRKVKKEKREISKNKNDFIACADSRVMVYKVSEDLLFNVKQSTYSVESILQNKNLAEKYKNGLCIVFRLCVDDYHRYSFIDDGILKNTYQISGRLHTVSPIVYSHYKVFHENTRQVSILETENFKTVTEVDVGALMVGKIVNHKKEKFQKGEEKGYFEFGGSTVILFLEKDQVEIDKKILDYSKKNIEVKVKLGTVIGKKKV